MLLLIEGVPERTDVRHCWTLYHLLWDLYLKPHNNWIIIQNCNKYIQRAAAERTCRAYRTISMVIFLVFTGMLQRERRIKESIDHWISQSKAGAIVLDGNVAEWNNTYMNQVASTWRKGLVGKKLGVNGISLNAGSGHTWFFLQWLLSIE